MKTTINTTTTASTTINTNTTTASTTITTNYDKVGVDDIDFLTPISISITFCSSRSIPISITDNIYSIIIVLFLKCIFL